MVVPAARGPFHPVLVARVASSSRRPPPFTPLGSPPLLSPRGTLRPGPLRAVLVAVVWGGLIAALSRPVIGALAALLTLAGSWCRPARVVVRAVLRLGASATLVALGVYVIAQQHRYRYLPTIEWPADLSAGNDLAWTALALLSTDVVVGSLWVTVAARRLRSSPEGQSGEGE